MAWALQFDGVNDEVSFTPVELLINDYIEFDVVFLAGATIQYFIDSDGTGVRPYFYLYNNLSFDSSRLTLTVDGTPYTSGSFTPVQDTQYTIKLVAKTTVNFGAFGKRFNGASKATVKLINLTVNKSSSDTLKWDATASDHSNTGSQPVLVDTIGGNNATGVGFATDGSAWVDLGGGGVTGTGILESDASILTGPGIVLHTGISNLTSADSELYGIGNAFTIHSGTGLLASEDSLLSGTGTTGGVVSGTGDLATSESELSGIGVSFSIITGQGDLQLSDSVVIGAGISFSTIDGVGSLVNSNSELSGSGVVASGIAGSGSFVVGTISINGIGVVTANIIGIGSFQGQSDLSGIGNIIKNIIGSGTFELSESILSGTGSLSVKVFGSGALSAEQSLLKGYDVLYNWFETGENNTEWTQLNKTEISMIRCGPIPVLKSYVYPNIYPTEIATSSIDGLFGINIDTIVQEVLSAGDERVNSNLNGLFGINIDTIVQEVLSAGDERVDSSVTGVLIIDTIVIGQVSLSAGDERVNSNLSGALGIEVV